MIHPHSVYRLASHIVQATLESLIDEDDVREPSDAAKREALIDLAGRYDLDVEDVATLYRIAAGEGVELTLQAQR
jgi:hypothetical protein